MSYNNGINKKNLRLKNLSFITPLSNQNIVNLISENQRLITNSNNKRINLPQQSSNNEQQKNQILNEVFKIYSSNRQVNTNNHLKKPNINLNYITNNQVLNNINLKHYKNTSPSNSSMYNTFANFPTNTKRYSNNSNNKNVFKNSSQNYTRNVKNKKNSLTNNNSLNNFNLTQGKENNLLISTNIINNKNNNEILNSTTSQFQKYTSNIDMLNKKKNLIIHNNTHHHQQNFSSDFVNNFNTPLSASTSMNNVVNFYNEIYNNKLDCSKNNINSGLNNSKGNNYISYQSDQNAFNTTKESTIGKKFIKTLNSNSCNSNNENEFINTKNVESPEELHFYFINVIQNGKELEGKFDIINSINSKN